MTSTTSHRVERAGIWTSIVASLLIGLLGVVFAWLTGAEAILLDGVFNLTYFVTSLFSLQVMRLLERGEDEEFPVGYVFFEPLVNGIKGILILGVTVMAAAGAIEALGEGGREIEVGLALVYACIAAVACWGTFVFIRRCARRSGSPLVEADAASWVVNAIVSSAVLGTLAVVLSIQGTPLEWLTPYVDPVLVLALGLLTIAVPVRIGWNALLQLLNHSPSREVRTGIEETIAATVADLPVRALAVRVIQPGRTRLVSAHILLDPGFTGGLAPLDAAREKADARLRERHPTTIVDLLFTADPRWSAPLASGGKKRSPR